MNYRLVTITNNVNNMNRDQKIKELQGGIVISNLLQHLRSREMYTLHRWLHGSGARNRKHKGSFTRTVLVVSFLNSTYSDVPLSEALNWDWEMTPKRTNAKISTGNQSILHQLRGTNSYLYVSGLSNAALV